MTTTWKPESYNSVSVYIVADNAQWVIDFLKQTFDAAELRRFDNPDGKIMHAEVRIDDTVVMIANAGGAYPAFPVWLHVYVPDAQATYKKALAAGGVSVQEPVHKHGDPDLRGGVKDPCGNTWWISTQMAP
jgi:PhnB protein